MKYVVTILIALILGYVVYIIWPKKEVKPIEPVNYTPSEPILDMKG